MIKEPTKSECINDYYMLSELCNDDVHYMAFLLHMLHTKTPSYILTELSMLRVEKVSLEIDLLLSHLSKQDFKNLFNLYKETQDATVQKMLSKSKLVARQTTTK